MAAFSHAERNKRKSHAPQARAEGADDTSDGNGGKREEKETLGQPMGHIPTPDSHQFRLHAVPMRGDLRGDLSADPPDASIDRLRSGDLAGFACAGGARAGAGAVDAPPRARPLARSVLDLYATSLLHRFT